MAPPPKTPSSLVSESQTVFRKHHSNAEAFFSHHIYLRNQGESSILRGTTPCLHNITYTVYHRTGILDPEPLWSMAQVALECQRFFDTRQKPHIRTALNHQRYSPRQARNKLSKTRNQHWSARTMRPANPPQITNSQPQPALGLAERLKVILNPWRQ